MSEVESDSSQTQLAVSVPGELLKLVSAPLATLMSERYRALSLVHNLVNLRIRFEIQRLARRARGQLADTTG